jgi:hypothetical protein
MTKERKQFHNAELHVELMQIVRHHSTGLITDIELLLLCQGLQECYAKLDLSKLCDPNTGLRYPEGYNPFASKE